MKKFVSQVAMQTLYIWTGIAFNKGELAWMILFMVLGSIALVVYAHYLVEEDKEVEL